MIHGLQMFIFWVLASCSFFVHAMENLEAANARLQQTNSALKQALRQITAQSAVGGSNEKAVSQANESSGCVNDLGDEHCSKFTDYCLGDDNQNVRNDCAKACGLCETKGACTDQPGEIDDSGNTCAQTARNILNGMIPYTRYCTQLGIEDKCCESCTREGVLRADRCTDCSCVSFVKGRYWSCRPVTKENPCTDTHCVKCKVDGVNSMPGPVTKHEEECEAYSKNYVEPEPNTEKCICASTWTEPGYCDKTQRGCPSTACDNPYEERWCIIANEGCAEDLGGYAECNDDTPVSGV